MATRHGNLRVQTKLVPAPRLPRSGLARMSAIRDDWDSGLFYRSALQRPAGYMAFKAM